MGNTINANIEMSSITEHWSANGMRILKYSQEISFPEMNEYKLISAPDIDILEQKVEVQIAKWKEKFTKIVNKQQATEEKEANIGEAEGRTKEALKELSRIDGLLTHTLSIDDTVDWEQLKKRDKFKETNPKSSLETEIKNLKKPPPPDINTIPEPPNIESYNPKFNLFDKLIKSKKETKIADSELRYNKDYTKWKNRKKELEQKNESINEKHKQTLIDWEKLIENKKI